MTNHDAAAAHRMVCGRCGGPVTARSPSRQLPVPDTYWRHIGPTRPECAGRRCAKALPAATRAGILADADAAADAMSAALGARVRFTIETSHPRELEQFAPHPFEEL